MTTEEFVDLLDGVEPARQGAEYDWMSLCPAHDDRSPSLHITAVDDGSTLVKCFAGCTTEDIMVSLGLSLGDLFTDGTRRKPTVREAQPKQERPKVYQEPKSELPTSLSKDIEWWFEKRRIDLDVVKQHGIVGDHKGLHFPYHRDGKLVNIKHRYPEKKFTMEPGCELVFWGLDDCLDAEQVVIVEGEMDALALYTVGFKHVLSVPNGASTGQMTYLESAADIFDRCHTIIVAVDGDEPGLKLEAALINRIEARKGCLGKCHRVRWPEGCKDANDVLMVKGGDELARCIAAAEPTPVAGIMTADDKLTDLLTLYKIGGQKGVSTGWREMDRYFTVALGQLTIVTGVPGSGKSEWTDSLVLNLARREGWPVGIYSPENYPPHRHDRTLAEKYLGKPFHDGPTPRMTEADVFRFNEWSADKVIHIDPEEPSLDAVIEHVMALIWRYGIKIVVIDPWNEIEHERPSGLTDTEYIGKSLARLRRLAKQYSLVIIVVAHPRIMRREDGKVPVPTPYDINGSANWFNKADNCISVSRDKDDDEAPVQIHVQKIRFREVGRLGIAKLYYDRVTGRYFDPPETIDTMDTMPRQKALA